MWWRLTGRSTTGGHRSRWRHLYGRSTTSGHKLRPSSLAALACSIIWAFTLRRSLRSAIAASGCTQLVLLFGLRTEVPAFAVFFLLEAELFSELKAEPFLL